MHKRLTLLDIYDADMRRVNDAGTLANCQLKWARDFSQSVLQKLNIVYHDRGPGFLCWTSSKLKNWYATPRDVVIELDQLNLEEADAATRLQEKCGPSSEESAARILDSVAGRA